MGKDLNRCLAKEDKQIISGQKRDQHHIPSGNHKVKQGSDMDLLELLTSSHNEDPDHWRVGNNSSSPSSLMEHVDALEIQFERIFQSQTSLTP